MAIRVIFWIICDIFDIIVTKCSHSDCLSALKDSYERTLTSASKCLHYPGIVSPHESQSNNSQINQSATMLTEEPGPE